MYSIFIKLSLLIFFRSLIFEDVFEKKTSIFAIINVVEEQGGY